jgi:hypothetical protein
LPSADPPPKGPPTPGKRFEVRERRDLLPGAGSGFPTPEEGLVAADCDALTHGGPPIGPDCSSGDIRCGETVLGATRGGVRRYDTRFYESNFCTPATTDHDGGEERVYRLHMPDGDWTAVVTLDTPCADLDLAAMKLNGETCPTAASMVAQCEMYPKDGTRREAVRLVTQRETDWWIVVEGKGAAEGGFALTVQCRAGIR